MTSSQSISQSSPLRVLLAKPGLDGHDRAALVLAHTLMATGCEVIYTGLHATPHSIVRSAVDEDVDVIGLSIYSGSHLILCEQILTQLSAAQFSPALVVGGPIPHADRTTLCSE